MSMVEDYYEVWMDLCFIERFDSYDAASKFAKSLMRNHKTAHIEIQTYFKEA